MARARTAFLGRLAALALLSVLGGGCLPLVLDAAAALTPPDTSPDGCTSEGRYYVVGTLKPGNPCRVCERRNGFAPRPDGAACGEGRRCEDAVCIGER